MAGRTEIPTCVSLRRSWLNELLSSKIQSLGSLNRWADGWFLHYMRAELGFWPAISGEFLPEQVQSCQFWALPVLVRVRALPEPAAAGRGLWHGQEHGWQCPPKLPGLARVGKRVPLGLCWYLPGELCLMAR